MEADVLRTGEAFVYVIPNVSLDGVAVTNPAQLDTFTAEIKWPDGTSTGQTGVFAQSSVGSSTWEAELIAPAVAGRVVVTALATKGTSQGVWEVEKWIHART